MIIYDGACPVCSQAIAWVRENEAEGAFETVPCQEKDHSGRFAAITTAACMQAMQLVLPGGTVLSGEKALPEVLDRMRSAWYRRLAQLFKMPGSGMVSRLLYRWFARHRYGIAHLMQIGRSKAERMTGERTWQRKMS